MIQGTTSNSGLTNDGSPLYPPGTSVYVGSYLVVASSPEELAQLLNYLSAICKKPIDELTCTDVNLNLVSKGLATKDLTTDPPIIAMTPKGESDLANFNNQQYFGDHLPFYSDSIKDLQTHPFDKSATGAELDYKLSGVQSTVLSIYTANYPAGSTDPLLTPEQISALPSDTVDLIHQLFGPNTPLTQGQLNVLKLLGYVNGQPSDLSSWTLTEDGTGLGSGRDLLAAFKDPNHKALIPSDTSYHADNSGTSAQIVDAYFNEDGSGLSPTYATDDPEKLRSINEMIRLQIKNLIEATHQTNESKLVGLTLDENTKELLNNLLGKDKNNVEFTASEINSAVALGFITYDPSNNSVAITNPGRGNTFLNNTHSVENHDNEIQHKDDEDKQTLQKLDDFIWALNIIQQNWNKFDNPNNPDDPDGVISDDKDLPRIIEMYGADSDMGKAAKILMDAHQNGTANMLFIGNKNKNDHKFSHEEFGRFFTGVQQLRDTLADKTNVPKDADGHVPLNYAKIWNDWNSRSSDITWINALLYMGDQKFSGRDQDAVQSLLNNFIPSN